MAAGEMDVDRRVERDARLAPARDLLGVALGVGGGELAAGIAGAGDEAGADRVGLDGQAERFDLRLARLRALSVGTPEISRFCQTVSRISPSPRSRATSARPRICATVRRPTGTTTPIQLQPVLLLRVNADMRGARERRAAAPARRARRGRACGRAFPPSAPRNFSTPILSSTYFSRALVRSVRSP